MNTTLDASPTAATATAPQADYTPGTLVVINPNACVIPFLIFVFLAQGLTLR